MAVGTRGAVYVEFLAVFFPIFSFFMGLVQYAFIQTAAVIVQHGAMKGARTASVIIYDHPRYWGGDAGGRITGPKRALIEETARLPLTTLGSANSAQVSFNETSFARNDPVTVIVDYNYTCRVPLGRILACGADGIKPLRGTATLPNHGAEFRY
jgi:hypothetical protein